MKLSDNYTIAIVKISDNYTIAIVKISDNYTIAIVKISELIIRLTIAFILHSAFPAKQT